jgi:hypothetical protein
VGKVALTQASNDGTIEVEASRIVALTPDGHGTAVHLAGADGREKMRIPVRESEARIRELIAGAGGGDA